VRVALARLCASGVVERDERGRYRLGAPTEAIRSRVAWWRRMDERLREWDGSWVALHTAARTGGRGRDRERSLRARRLLGFRELSTGLELRPDNLVGGVAWVREQLASLGLEPEILTSQLRALDPESERRARTLWDADALEAGYRASLDALARSEKHLPGLSREQSMVESFLIGGRVLRQLVLDPLLPERIVSASARRELVDAMQRYDARGRACWAEFLRSFEVLDGRAPVDLRVSEAAEGLGAAPEADAWTPAPPNAT